MSHVHQYVELPNLEGKRILITGASDGIGVQIATRLASMRAELILPVRNQTKGNRVVSAIRERYPQARIDLEQLDLSSLDSARALAERLNQRHQPINTLINNAGIMTPPERRTSADGLELQFGTNVIGHVALVALLMPLLRQGRARVTSQISVAANQGRINWTDLQWKHSYDPMGAYSQSKIALGLFGLELDRRSQALGWGITSNLAHPGIAPTNLLASRPEMGRTHETVGRRMVSTLSHIGLAGTAQSAAEPALFAAASPKARGRAFYGPGGFAHMSGGPKEQQLYRCLRSEEDAARVWDLCEHSAGVSFGRTE